MPCACLAKPLSAFACAHINKSGFFVYFCHDSAVLKSGREGSYPDLQEFARQRLIQVNLSDHLPLLRQHLIGFASCGKKVHVHTSTNTHTHTHTHTHLGRSNRPARCCERPNKYRLSVTSSKTTASVSARTSSHGPRAWRRRRQTQGAQLPPQRNGCHRCAGNPPPPQRKQSEVVVPQALQRDPLPSPSPAVTFKHGTSVWLPPRSQKERGRFDTVLTPSLCHAARRKLP